MLNNSERNNSICISKCYTCSLIDKSNIKHSPLMNFVFNILSGKALQIKLSVKTFFKFSFTIISNPGSFDIFYLFMKKTLMYALNDILFKPNMACVLLQRTRQTYLFFCKLTRYLILVLMQPGQTF